MPRPKKCRIIFSDPISTYFKPVGIPFKELGGKVAITLEELEAMRLVHFEGLNQQLAANNMQISQSTISMHLDSAHYKLTKALLFGLAIRITNPNDIAHCSSCGHSWKITVTAVQSIKVCEKCFSDNIHFHLRSDQREMKDKQIDKKEDG